jgi:hypothetical protein
MLMARPNFAFAKRQRELAKKQKKQEKLQRKSAVNEPAEPQPAEAQPPLPEVGSKTD